MYKYFGQVPKWSRQPNARRFRHNKAPH